MLTLHLVYDDCIVMSTLHIEVVKNPADTEQNAVPAGFFINLKLNYFLSIFTTNKYDKKKESPNAMIHPIAA